MADKDLLQRLDIRIDPSRELNVGEMTNNEVIHDVINHNQKGQGRNYFALAFGSALFADGFADLGAQMLEYVSSITTTRNIDMHSIIEIIVGLGAIYFGGRNQHKKTQNLQNLTESLTDYYVQD